MHSRLGAQLLRVHRCLVAVDDIFVEAILEETLRVSLAVMTTWIGFVFAEQQLGFGITVECVGAEFVMLRLDAVARGGELRFRAVVLPGPVLRNQSCGSRNRRGFWAAIVGGDEHQDVLGTGLGVFDEYVPIAVVVEDAGLPRR